MKNLPLYLLIVGITFIILAQWLKYKEAKSELKPYSVIIIHGSPMISYESTLQVDSLKYISKESVIVYLNGSTLIIKADYITFKKN